MIPHIIHQIWIGDLYSPPLQLMQTWKECADTLNVEYIFWNEAEITKRGIVFECQPAIDAIPEINGKADIMRWEILKRYGGIFIDADSICVEPLLMDFFTPSLMNNIEPHTDIALHNIEINDNLVVGFAAFENEQVRPGLVATGTMGFTPYHPLVIDIVDWLRDEPPIAQLQEQKAWFSVGPGCITRFLETGKYKDIMVIFPSHYFIPIHYTPESTPYTGHQKVYGHQLWGTGEQTYRKNGGGNNMQPQLPDELLPPPPQSTPPMLPFNAVSILINSFNTPKRWVHECLQSIQNQKGHFMMELVWVDDGSTPSFATDLTEEIEWFQQTTRFVSNVVIHRMPENVGTRKAIDTGLSLCTNELIIKMDADDMMFSTRIQKQLQFMNNNPQVVCCGGQLIQFTETGSNNEKISGRITNHPFTITDDMCYNWNWFMNHPTLCYRKWAVESIGGYGIGQNLGEDRELEVKLFKHYGEDALCNLKDILIMYRMHPYQLSHGSP